MAYSLRLPPVLDARARERAADLGISLNALVCVALDAYLRAGIAIPAASPAGPSDQPSEPPESPDRAESPAPAVDVPDGLTRKQFRKLQQQREYEERKRQRQG